MGTDWPDSIVYYGTGAALGSVYVDDKFRIDLVRDASTMIWSASMSLNHIGNLPNALSHPRTRFTEEGRFQLEGLPGEGPEELFDQLLGIYRASLALTPPAE